MFPKILSSPVVVEVVGLKSEEPLFIEDESAVAPVVVVEPPNENVVAGLGVLVADEISEPDEETEGGVSRVFFSI